MQKAKELKLLQEEELTRKDVEIEAEKKKRRVMQQFADEKIQIEHEQKENIVLIKETFEKKINLSKQKREVKNDKLLETENSCTQLVADIEKIQKDADKNIDRRVQQLNKQLRADNEHYRRTLHEQKEGKLLQIQNELNMQLKQKQGEFEQMRNENRAKDDESRKVLRISTTKRLETEQEKI